MMAYKIERDCQNVIHVIYEKNEDIGGTWLENRYPGCACDVPSHAYTYNFALNVSTLSNQSVHNIADGPDASSLIGPDTYRIRQIFGLISIKYARLSTCGRI